MKSTINLIHVHPYEHHHCDFFEMPCSKSAKKVSVVAFPLDSSVFLAGNKFGDVLVASTVACDNAGPETLLGHYCSILTSVSLSCTGSLLATTDRDAKVRVSVMPKEPMKGGHNIQSYCFGHTKFVTCSAFIGASDEILLTGSGDGTVKVWNPQDGSMLCSVSVGSAEGGGEGENVPVVLSIVPSKDGKHAVVVVDGEASIRILAVDAAAGTAAICARCTLHDFPMITDLAIDSDGKFWLAGGPVGSEGTSALVACAELSADGQMALCDPQPLTAEAKAQLQKCSVSPADVQPSSHLPAYLDKKPFNSNDDKRRRRAPKTEGDDDDA